MKFPALYFDFNATTPLDQDLKSEVPNWVEAWGNPSSIHWAGRASKTILREARRNIARLLNCDALELIFTSGGSEANNLVLKGAVALPSTRNQIIVSSVEHPSVMKAVESLRRKGWVVDMIPVNREGALDLLTFEKLLSERTALVSVMFANNETGHIFPIQTVARMAHAAGALVHCDGVQALGKVPVDVREWGVDFATFSGHKFYALKGCGILYARKGMQLESLIQGGGQERGRRAGTENILAIASLGAMAVKADQILAHAEEMKRLRDHFEQRCLQEIFKIHITGGEGLRVPNTSSLVIEGVDGETLLMNLDVRGFAVSTGAACSSGNPEPSPTLLAMGLSRAEAQSSLRVSLGWTSTLNEVDALVDTLKLVVAKLRSFKHGEAFAYGI